MSNDINPIYVFWKTCTECDYETVAHGEVACPRCGCRMTSVAIAGAVVDDRQPVEEDDD